MAALPDDFDYADDPSASFEPVPTCDVILSIRDSERKDTSSGNGEMYEITFEILEGPHKGRDVRKWFNIVNPNPKAEKIGRQQLRDLAKAVGKPQFGDTCDLHDIPFIAQIVCYKDKHEEMRNDVKKFRRKTAEAVAAMNGAQQEPAGEDANDNPFRRQSDR